MNLSQTVISSKMKHAPNIFAFTEQGVAMLSTVLKSERAVNVNIEIMRTFVRLRQMLASNTQLARKLKSIAILNHNKPTAYLIPAETYELIMERLEDHQLGLIVNERQNEKIKAVEIDIDEL